MILANRSQICAYGNHRILRPTIANRENSRRIYEPNRFLGKATSDSQRNEYLIDGVTYTLVTSLKDYDVVLCPDKTYGKVDRRTRKFLGAY